MTTTSRRTPTPTGLPTQFRSRVLEEAHLPGAWHGPDLHTALADVTAELAFQRPGPGRHNIAEIALHHAFYVHAVRSRIGGTTEPFVREGDDWFTLANEHDMPWTEVQRVVSQQYERLAALVEQLDSGQRESPLREGEQFDNIIGITCHAAYHAGQIQLVKALLGQPVHH